MPFLSEIDLSNASVTESALRRVAHACPVLQTLTWNNSRTSTHISGECLSKCSRLKGLYMDNSIFYCNFVEFTVMQIEELGVDYCILYDCKRELQRVSLKNARYRCSFFQSVVPPQALPQMALVKFVLQTPSLRWFRSDLSPENVAVLQAE
jgi:hypothetical protein